MKRILEQNQPEKFRKMILSVNYDNDHIKDSQWLSSGTQTYPEIGIMEHY